MSPAWSAERLPAGAAVALPRHEVHVWLVALAATEERRRDLAALLSPDERRRAARFAFPHLRARFATARGTLRLILGAYAGMPPADVALTYGNHGKPALAEGGVKTNLEFNLAHSDDVALIAVARARAVGVDVEGLRPLPDHARLAVRYFSPEERRALSSLPADVQPRAFFACWTRKEAYLKARGSGLSVPLDAFSVPVDPRAAPGPLAVRGDAGGAAEAARWRLVDLHPPGEFAAALVAEGRDLHPVSRCLKP